MSVHQCDEEVYKSGEHVATAYRFDKNEVEQLTIDAARATGERVDWFYSGGRPVIFALGDCEAVRAYLSNRGVKIVR